jgi:hypothetical protein
MWRPREFHLQPVSETGSNTELARPQSVLSVVIVLSGCVGAMARHARRSQVLGKHFAASAEPELREEPLELPLGGCAADITLEPSKQRHVDPGAVGREITRVEVDNGRKPASLHGLHAALHEAVRRQPKVPPAREAESPTQEPMLRQGQFRNGPSRGKIGESVRGVRTGISPVPAPGGEEAGVPEHPVVEKLVQRPFAARPDRETRCSEALRRNPARRTDRADRIPEVLPKLRSGHGVDSSVPERMRPDLVAAVPNASNQVGIAFRNPTQDEEGGSGSGSLERVEDLVGVPLDEGREVPPVGRIFQALHLDDVEPILDVE